MYVINIIGNSYSYTTKVISDYFTTNEAELTYLSIEKQKSDQAISKTTQFKFDMAYTTGNELLFTGYSGRYISQKTDVPTSSKTILFSFTGPKTKTTPVWSCGDSITINFVAGNVAPVTKTATYGTVTNIPGEESKCWISSNLGADHQAQNYDDDSEASAGWYWQFDLQQGYKNDGQQRIPNSNWINSITIRTDWTADNDPCTLEMGGGWRIPTSTEWSNVSGYWNTLIDAWNTDLKIHAAGYLYSQDGSLDSRGTIGRYWSSSQYTKTIGTSLYLDFNDCYMDNSSDNAFGFTLRCLMDSCTVTTANAGPSQTVCDTTTTLAGNNPSPDTGQWTIVSGSGGYFSNASAYNSSFTGIAGTNYSLLWTIKNPSCSDSSYSGVKISLTSLPTTANAGPNQTVCGDSTTLAGNKPLIGTGLWTVVSGNGGFFGNVLAYNSSFTGTPGIIYTLRWTISNPPCPDSYSDVKISLVAPPTVANAGPDQSVCGDSTTLAGNNPTVGTGQWTIISGFGGSIGNASLYNSSFTGIGGTTYILRWTISNPPCPDSYSDVNIEFSSGGISITYAGPNQTVCGSTTTLAAKNPNPGYGHWTVESGTGGSFGNAFLYNSSFSGDEGTTYVLRWTVDIPPCPPSHSDVTIRFKVPPTKANAGPDQTVCDTSTTLDGNNPAYGTGQWNVVSGIGGHLVNPSLYNSIFTGKSSTTYILTWTISAPDSCPPSVDSVIISFSNKPYSYAGPDQYICGDSTTLAANNPSPGKGAWSVISGSGYSFGNDSVYNSSFSGTRGTTYTLTWKVTNANCSFPSYDTVNITFDTMPTTATAGPNQFVYGTTTTLAGNNPYPFHGLWTVLSHSGGTFGNDTAHHSSFTGTAGTTDTLRWTISNGACHSYSDVLIRFWGCGDSITIFHDTIRHVAPVNKTVTYGTVTNIPGEPTKCWITQNLGASRQAQYATDTSEPSAGWYWQFNRKQGYKAYGDNVIIPNFPCNTINENSDWASTNDPCTIELGNGWRLPDSLEWYNVNYYGGWNWSGFNGPWTSPLRLNTAGYLDAPNCELARRGGVDITTDFWGEYWSSNQHNWGNPFVTANEWGFNYYVDGVGGGSGWFKADGNTIRCIKD
jgi:hypothetical protein